MTLPKTGSSLRGDVTNCTVTEHPRLGILAPDDYTNAKHTQNSEIFVEYEGDKSHNEPYTRISRRRRKSKTLGTNEEQQDVSNSGFTGAEKRLWIELYRVSRSTSTQDILQYIRKRPGFNDVECRVSSLQKSKDISGFLLPHLSTKLMNYITQLSGLLELESHVLASQEIRNF
ncbi:hypothetical protein JTB14_037197 [Gonioctena quinquepunctata]|nr:hypothetical protein JTB14_037197 [Gonioctena quinquepunctata]